jgi:hypothetical protein
VEATDVRARRPGETRDRGTSVLHAERRGIEVPTFVHLFN